MATDVNELLRREHLLNRIARLYAGNGKVSVEYKTVPDPTPDVTECLKRTFIFDGQDRVVGEQIKTEIWTQTLEDLVSPPITNIQISNLSIDEGLPAGTTIGTITVTGGVTPLTIELSSNPGNLFRIDNDNELTLNSPSVGGDYPITVRVTDDDGKIESQNFSVNVVDFANSKSMQFDGVDEYINCGTGASLQFEKNDPFSISLWVKNSATGGTQNVIGNWGALKGWNFRIASGGHPNVLMSDGSNHNDVGLNSFNISDEIWHHLVMTYDGSESANGVKIYVDGVDEGATVNTNNVTGSIVTTNEVSIGAQDGGSQFYLGYLDEVAIFNKELSPSEVSTIYNSGSPDDLVGFSGLIHWWRMGDIDTFPTIPDQEGLNNGTAINMEALDVKEDTA